MKRTMVIVSIVAALSVSGIFLVRSILSREPEASKTVNQKKSPVVDVVSAETSEVSLGLDLTGSAEPYRVAQLASPAEGPVLDIRVREGDRVQAGDQLLFIGRKKGVDAVTAALREESNSEEDNLRRTRQLVDSGALPGEHLDQARAAFEKVHAQLVKAEEAAQDYAITAPWAGLVSRVIVKEGEFVAPRTALLEMYDPSSMVIRAAVSEKYAADVKAGMLVDVSLDAYPDHIMRGRVARVYPYLDPRLRTRTIEVVSEKAVGLLPGMFARLKVVLRSVTGAVVVPVEAVVTTPDGQRVVFVTEDGKAVRRLVETGIEEGDRVEIIAGVLPGEKVIVAGNEKIKDGAAVSVAGGENSGKRKPDDPTGQPAGEETTGAGGRR